MFIIYDYEITEHIAETEQQFDAITFAQMYSKGTEDRPSKDIWIYETFNDGTSTGEKPIAFISHGIVYEPKSYHIRNK